MLQYFNTVPTTIHRDSTKASNLNDTTETTDNTSNTSISKSTSTFLPIPTRTINQMSSTQLMTESTTNVQPTGTIDTTRISQVHTGSGSNENNNTALIIVLLLLMVVLLTVAIIHLMLTLKNQKMEDSHC